MSESRSSPVNWRSAHKWTAIILAIPLLFLTVTGIFLQLRADVSWIQPPVLEGSTRYQPTLPMDKVLEAASAVPRMQVSGWSDIQMLDLRPEEGIVKIRTWKEMETQIDATTGAVLSVDQRLNDIVSAMHDGSRWGMRLWIGLPVALLTLLLIAGGSVLVWRQTLQKLRAARVHSESGRRAAADSAPRPRVTASLCVRRLAWQSHYWLSLVVLIPWVVVAISGLVLQLRYQLDWVMPGKIAGVSTTPTLPFTAVYEAARTVPEVQVERWEDVWRIYYYPQDGTASVMVRQGARQVETQIDFNTGKVLDVSVRAKDLLEDIHEGKFYNAHLWWFLPAHLVALLLWLTGAIMTFGRR